MRSYDLFYLFLHHADVVLAAGINDDGWSSGVRHAHLWAWVSELPGYRVETEECSACRAVPWGTSEYWVGTQWASGCSGCRGGTGGASGCKVGTRETSRWRVVTGGTLEVRVETTGAMKHYSFETVQGVQLKIWDDIFKASVCIVWKILPHIYWHLWKIKQSVWIGPLNHGYRKYGEKQIIVPYPTP